LVKQKRLASDLDERLRKISRQRAQPHSTTPSEDRDGRELAHPSGAPRVASRAIV
jgi:hypothetical protein